MKVFAVAGFSVLFALISMNFIESSFALIIGVVCVAIFLLAALVSKGKILKSFKVLSVALLSVSLAFLLYGFSYNSNFAYPQGLSLKGAEIQAQIMDYPEKQYGKFYYKIRVEQMDLEGEKTDFAPFTARLSTSIAIPAQPYDYIKCNVGFYDFTDSFGLSAKGTNMAKGYGIACYSKDFEVEVNKLSDKPFSYYIKRFRKELTTTIKATYGEPEGGVISAAILGDKSAIDADVEANFRKVGVSHFLVVSGFHLSIIIGFMLALFKAFKLPNKICNILAIIFVFFFMVMSGMHASIVRSSIMMVMWLLSDIIGAENDSINSLGLSVLVICLLNPMSGGDIGFLMSAFATLGIIKAKSTIYGAMMKPFVKSGAIKKIFAPVFSALSVSISATLFVLPISVLVFGEISLIAPIVTIIITIPMSLMIVLAIISLVLTFTGVFAPIALPFTLLASLLSRFSIWIVGVFSQFNLFSLNVKSNIGLIIFCAVLIIISVTLLLNPSKRIKLTAVFLSLFIVGFGMGLNAIKYIGVTSIAVANVGEDSSVVMIKDKEAIVLTNSGYNSFAVLDILKQNNISRVKAIFIESDDRKSIDSAINIIDNYSPEAILVSNEIYKEKKLKNKLSQIDDESKVISSEEIKGISVNGNYIEHHENGGFKLRIDDKTVIVEDEGEISESADIVITSVSEREQNSAFTVMQSDDIIEDKINFSGSVVFTKERDITYIDFLKNGKLELRRES